MKTTANVVQVKARLSEYLRQVKGGGEVVITERGIPIARIAPLAPDEKRATREDRLIRAGVLRPASAKRKALGVPTLKRGAGAAVLAALLADRDEGR
jgi:prevent-host-death family protein